MLLIFQLVHCLFCKRSKDVEVVRVLFSHHYNVSQVQIKWFVSHKAVNYYQVILKFFSVRGLSAAG